MAEGAEPADEAPESGGSPLAAHVLLLLWAHARTDKATGVTTAWCSFRRLADLTASYKKSIYAVLDRLRRDGWITATEIRKKDGKRLADRYTLAFPGEAGEAHRQMLARLGANDGPAITSPLVLPGDVFHYNGAWHVREARIPLPVLGSWAWTELRRASPLAMHVYCLLVAYAPDDEHLGGTRLAREARLHKSRVPETIATLVGLGWIEVRERWDGKRRLADAFVLREVASRMALSPENPAAAPALADGDASTAETIPAPPPEQFNVGKPPADLVEQLAEDCPGLFTADYSMADLDVWGLLLSMGLWPRPAPVAPLSPEQQATALVVEFHVATTAHGPDYVPTRKEARLAEGLLDAYGVHSTRDLLRHVLGKMRRTRYIPGDFGAVRRYLPDAARAVRLDPAPAQGLAAG